MCRSCRSRNLRDLFICVRKLLFQSPSFLFLIEGNRRKERTIFMSRITTINSLQNTRQTNTSGERPTPTPGVAGGVALISAMLDHVMIFSDHDAGTEICFQAYSNPKSVFLQHFASATGYLQSPQGPQLKRPFWYGRVMMIDLI
jgi:hypothetical protein